MLIITDTFGQPEHHPMPSGIVDGEVGSEGGKQEMGGCAGGKRREVEIEADI